ncbi:MAG: 2-oxoacid:acceptor oxidoreductase subunit alpha, partial [Pseudomonadota bacterium]
DRLAADGVVVSYLRVRAFPFNAAVKDFIDHHRQVFVVEQNRDAQLRSLLSIDLEIDLNRLQPILHYNGMPITATDVVDPIMRVLKAGKAA